MSAQCMFLCYYRYRCISWTCPFLSTDWTATTGSCRWKSSSTFRRGTSRGRRQRRPIGPARRRAELGQSRAGRTPPRQLARRGLRDGGDGAERFHGRCGRNVHAESGGRFLRGSGTTSLYSDAFVTKIACSLIAGQQSDLFDRFSRSEERPVIPISPMHLNGPALRSSEFDEGVSWMHLATPPTICLPVASGQWHSLAVS